MSEQESAAPGAKHNAKIAKWKAKWREIGKEPPDCDDPGMQCDDCGADESFLRWLRTGVVSCTFCGMLPLLPPWPVQLPPAAA
jgi:hypothetical protein